MPPGPPLEVQLFESVDLPAHWPRLDEFGGPGEVAASIHVLR